VRLVKFWVYNNFFFIVFFFIYDYNDLLEVLMKKKIIMVLLLFVSLLFINDCKSSSFDFDVNGNWEVTITYPCGSQVVVNITFSGSAISGDVYVDGVKAGTYTLNDKAITFNYQTLSSNVTYYYDYTGNAKSDDEMEGDMSYSYENSKSTSSNISKPLIKVPVSKGTWVGKKKK